MPNKLRRFLYKLKYIYVYCQLRDLNITKADAKTLATIILTKAHKDH